MSRLLVYQRGPDLAEAVLSGLQDPDLGVREIALSNLDVAAADPRALPALRQQLASAPAQTRWLAVRTLATMPLAFVGLRDEVAKLAGDPDPLIRRTLLGNIWPGPGVEAIAKPLLETALMGSDANDLMAAARSWLRLRLAVPDTLVAKLSPALGSADEVAAGAASYALSTLWSPAVEDRIRSLAGSGAWGQRVHAADLLRKRKASLDLSWYAGLFSKADEPVQLYACGTLSRLADPNVAGRLREAGQSRYASVRQAAIYALESNGSEPARQVLTELLGHADGNVRYRAAVVLGRMGPGLASEQLRALAASDPDGDVRSAAAIAVASDFGAVLPATERVASSSRGVLRVTDPHGSPAAIRGNVLQIGSQKQLLVDDLSLESLGGAARVFHKFKKDPRNPVLEEQFPWEHGGVSVYETSVVYDPERRLLRLYYYSSASMPKSARPPGMVGDRSSPQLLAVSAGGVRWIRPNIGQFEFGHSKANNLVGAANGIVRLPRSFENRYRYASYWPIRGKITYYGDVPLAVPFSMDVSFSPDGIKDWTELRPAGPLGSDVMAMGTDGIAGGYLGFTKWQAGWWMGESFGDNHGFMMKPSLRLLTGSRRSFASEYARNPDKFERGRLNVFALEGDDRVAPRYIAKSFAGLDYYAAEEMHSEIYQITPFPYEGIYFLIPTVFTISGPGKGNDDGMERLSLLFSRDRTGASGWSPNGQGRFEPLLDMGRWGEWDSTRIYATDALLVANDEIVLYYTGHTTGHSAEGSHDKPARRYFRSAVGRATLRLDGFASLRAVGREAEILTKPLAFEGDRLTVNVKGEIRAEILDEKGRPIAGFEREKCAAFSGDALRQSLTWPGSDLKRLAGQTVRVRFMLKNGDLYSYGFSSAPTGDRGGMAGK